MSVPSKAALNYASFHSLCCLMNRKVKYFKQCFYWNNVQYQKLQQVFDVLFFCLDTGPRPFFATRLLPCR